MQPCMSLSVTTMAQSERTLTKDQVAERLRQPGPQLAGRLRLPLLDRLQHLPGAAAAERQFARGHAVEDRAEAP